VLTFGYGLLEVVSVASTVQVSLEQSSKGDEFANDPELILAEAKP
jgi:hypothetical protein